MSQLPDLLRDVPRGVTSRYLHQQSVPQARWQSPDDIIASPALRYDPHNPGNKILLGAIGDHLIGFADNRHMMTVAGSRAGKSVTLIGNLFFWRGSALITDPKGELARMTAPARAALGQRVYVLDPFNYLPDELAEFRAGYNPLATLSLDSPTIIEDANLIADAIVMSSPDARDPHWDDSARDFIEGLILYVVTAPEYEGARHLVTVRNLIQTVMMDDPEDDSDVPLCVLEQAMLETAIALQDDPATEDVGRAIEGSARGFYEKADRERDSVLSTVRRHTKFLDYSALRRVLTRHDFSLADLKRAPEGMTVYLCFPATRISIAGRWLRMFINQLLDAMERQPALVDAPPVLVCLDEFPVLGYMRQLQNAAGQIASFGVKLWVVLQDWSQGVALYNKGWETFAGNAGIMQVFGNTDVTTTEYISKRLGRTPVEVVRTGEVSPEQAASGLSGRTSAIEMHDMLTSEEVTRMFSRDDPLKRQLILLAGYHPLTLQRVEYYDPDGALAPFIDRSAIDGA